MPLHNDPSASDKFSTPHIIVGAILGGNGVPRLPAYAVIGSVEVVEAVFRAFGVKFFVETPANVIFDIVAGIAGYEASRLAVALGKRVKV